MEVKKFRRLKYIVDFSHVDWSGNQQPCLTAPKLNDNDKEVKTLNGKSLLIGFLAGGAIASIATILSAPASGKETRHKLAENKEIALSELRELKDSLLQIKDSVAAASTEGKQVIADFINDVKLAIHEWKVETAPIKAELAKDLQALEQIVEDLEKNLATNQT